MNKELILKSVRKILLSRKLADRALAIAMILQLLFGSSVAIALPPLDKEGREFAAPLLMKELSATPSSPVSGKKKLYSKNDGKVYTLNSSGQEVEIGAGGSAATNFLTNGGFNDATATTGWTVSNGTATADTSNYVPPSTQALSIALSAVNGDVISQSFTPASALTGVNIEHSVWVKTASTTIQVCAMQGSTEVQCQTAPSTDKWTKVEFAGVAAPSSGSIGIKVKTSGSTTGTVKLDDAYVGVARNIGSVAQAEFVGTLTYAGSTNCQWSTSSTSYANFAADTDCATPTVTGSLTAAGTKIPGAVLTNAKPGYYLVIASGPLGKGSANDDVAQFRISDGTNAGGGFAMYFTTSNGYNVPTTVTASMTYATAQSTITWQLQGRVTNGTTSAQIVTNGSGADFEIKVYRFPLQSEQAVRASQQLTPTIQKFTSGSGTYTKPTNAIWIKVRMVGGGGGGGGGATSGSGGSGGAGGNTTFGSNLTANGGSGGSGGLAGGGYAGAGGSCSVTEGSGTSIAGARGQGGTTAGSTIYPSSGGGGSSALGGAGGSGASAQAGQAAETNSGSGGGGGNSGAGGGAGGGGGSGCFIEVVLTNPSSTYSYAVGAAGTLGSAGTGGAAGGAGAAGYIEVTEYYSSQAPLLVGSVTSNSSGMERVERARVSSQCTSSPCTVASQSGSWVTSITRSSTGAYSVTIPSGIFSASPTCTCSGEAAAVYTWCQASASSATAVAVYTSNGGSNTVDSAFGLICMGPR